FAALGDAYLDAGARRADRIGVGGAVGLHRDEGAHFGGAVDLLQVHAESAEETEGVGAERRAAGQAPARAAQADLVAHRPAGKGLPAARSNSPSIALSRKNS